MATSYNKRRTTSRSKSGRWGGSGWGSGSWRGTTRSSAKSAASGRSFHTIKNEIQKKIDSFQYLVSTTDNGNKNWTPTPATITKFANLVNKGAVIHKVTGRQIAKWAKWSRPCSSPTSALRVLKDRFGTAVKGVTYGPSGNFL